MIPRSENKKAMNCNKRSAQRLKLTAINKQEARSEKHNTTAKIGEQIDDEIAVRMKTYKTYLAKVKKSKEASNSEQKRRMASTWLSSS